MAACSLCGIMFVESFAFDKISVSFCALAAFRFDRLESRYGEMSVWTRIGNVSICKVYGLAEILRN